MNDTQTTPNHRDLTMYDVTTADPEETARLEDARERAALAAKVAHDDETSIANVAILLGQSTRHAGKYGRIGTALIDAAKGGTLTLAEPLTRVRCGTEEDYAVRHNLASAPVSRAALRVWIAAHGDDAMRSSPAAKWCGLTSENEGRTA